MLGDLGSDAVLVEQVDELRDEGRTPARERGDARRCGHRQALGGGVGEDFFRVPRCEDEALVAPGLALEEIEPRSRHPPAGSAVRVAEQTGELE